MSVFSVLYAYAAQTDEELTVSEADYLIVNEMDSANPDWIAAITLDGLAGLVPATYVEQMGPSQTINALYDYSAQTASEVSVYQGDSLQFYAQIDEEWILVGVQGQAGLVPISYTDFQSNIEYGEQFAAHEYPQEYPQETFQQEAHADQNNQQDYQTEDQRSKLFAALEGLGPAPVYKPIAAPPVPPPPDADFAPANTKLFPVTVRSLFSFN
jgi:hypothetical protein